MQKKVKWVLTTTIFLLVISTAAALLFFKSFKTNHTPIETGNSSDNSSQKNQVQSQNESDSMDTPCAENDSQPETPCFFVEKEGTLSNMGDTLKVKINGHTYQIIGSKEDMCMIVEEERDFDGNGTKDALIRHVTACGGNCCGDDFFFVFNDANQRFNKTDPFNTYCWGDPKIEKYQNTWSVIVVSNNMGMNTDAYEERTERFILKDGKPVKVEELKPKELPAVFEIHSRDLENAGENGKSYYYDIDEDGNKDEIICTFWERWGSMIWEIKFYNGKEFKSNTGCKRLGILESKTNACHDLVCDIDIVLKWNGTSY